jgi:hypothetical protein
MNPALNKGLAPEASKAAVNKETWEVNLAFPVTKPVVTINNKVA